MGQLAYHAGNAAEGAVARHYCAKGLEIVAKRWRAARADGGGEIDLIARNGTQIIFIEVKKSHSHAQAAQMLGARQMARIARSAAVFLAASPPGRTPRRGLMWPWSTVLAALKSLKTPMPPEIAS